mgnify:CR=1 FL=1|tara:strand:+ start:290 stop:724 length:435 start_codon:yes stop_codon:yes gene_type:complete
MQQWRGEPKILDSSKKEITSFVRSVLKGKQAKIPYDDIPFDRMVDFWYLAMCIGVKKGRKDSKSKMSDVLAMKDALTGSLDMIDMIQMIAIEETQDPYIVKDTHAMIQIANEYAAGGTPELLSILKDKGQTVWNLNTYLKDILS